MTFADIPFLFYFLPVFLGLYYVIPEKQREARNGIVIAGSLIFYVWGEGFYLGLLLFSVVMNHAIGWRLGRPERSVYWLTAGVGLNLALLIWYKYAGFIASVFGLTSFEPPRLPIGVSFFTFQSISYLVDIWRRNAKPTHRLSDTALYITSFPQLIAGPIVRFAWIAEEIRERKESVKRLAAGIKLFIIGLSQKVIFANTAAEPADLIFALQPNELTMPLAWAGAGAYTIQIFFDFAGYSNMAIGLGLMLGFHFPQNFNFPYISQSVTEFWRRWHMTLSGWFRDYLYIPLGGNRHGQVRTIANLWIVFVLCGLWHGAAWTFVFWGAWHGLLLSIERLGFSRILSKMPFGLSTLYTLVMVMIGWVLFRAETIEYGFHFITTMIGLGTTAHHDLVDYFPGWLPLILSISVICATPLPKMIVQWGAKYKVCRSLNLVGILLLLMICSASIAGGTYNPFIYSRF